MRWIQAFAVYVSVSPITACATPTTDPERLPAGSWQLDPAHASVVWEVQHFGLSWYVGRFDTVDASLEFDPARSDAAQLTAIIDPRSISTGDAAFDRELAEDWFRADAHPQIRFVSQRIEITGEAEGRAYGTLYMKGQTSEAVMDITFNGGLFNPLEGRNAMGFSARMEVDRRSHGIGTLPETILGHTVRIRIEAEFLEGGEAE